VVPRPPGSLAAVACFIEVTNMKKQKHFQSFPYPPSYETVHVTNWLLTSGNVNVRAIVKLHEMSNGCISLDELAASLADLFAGLLYEFCDEGDTLADRRQYQGLIVPLAEQAVHRISWREVAKLLVDTATDKKRAA
jgi:hypothetical protein